MAQLNFCNLNKLFVSDNLCNLNDEKELLLVTYGITDSYSISTFKQLWAKFDTSTKAVGRDEKHTKKVEPQEVGGALTLLDIDKNINNESRVLAEIDLNNPIAINFYPKTNELLVGLSDRIIAIQNGKIVRELHNNFFNSIHSIINSPNGIYVVCTAIDSIIEIDPSYPEKTLWRWSAPDHGLNISPRGEIVKIDIKNDYSKVGAIGSSHQATHINSVEIMSENKLLATLFHQDKLIIIDKNTGSFQETDIKLTNPHGIHKIENGFIVSNTRGNKVCLLDNDLKLVRSLEGSYNWVQDSIELGKYIVVADDNNGRLVLLDKNNYQIESILNWDNNKRLISGIYKIKVKYAKKVFIKNE